MDSRTGRQYQTGYYDENGNYYRDVVFTQQGKILENATAVVRCDYCGTEDSRPWADREKPCEHCGGNVTVVSQVDELENTGTWNANSGGAGKGCFIAVLIMILLPFVIGIGTLISGTIATALAPRILYGDGSIIGYIQPTDAVPNPAQSLQTKILLLFFYTVFHGIMMFLAGVPFFFYRLTGKTKEDIHNAVLEQREQMAISQGENDAEIK